MCVYIDVCVHICVCVVWIHMCVSVLACVSECGGLRMPSSAEVMDLCQHTEILNSGPSACAANTLPTE